MFRNWHILNTGDFTKSKKKMPGKCDKYISHKANKEKLVQCSISIAPGDIRKSKVSRRYPGV